MGSQGRTGGFAKTSHNIDHAIGNARLLDQLPQAEGRERCLFGWLEDYGATRGQGWTELPRRHEQGKVPGNNLAHDTNRLALGIGEELCAWGVGHRDGKSASVDFGGPASHIPEQIDGQW